MYISIFDSVPTWVIVSPILFCSVLMFAIVVERVIFYRQIRLDYRLIIKDCIELIKNGRLDDARLICARHSGPVMQAMEGIIESYAAGKTDDYIITDSSEQAIKKIEKYLGSVATIATLSPMLGLLGTVLGIMKSFGALSRVGPYAVDLLAGGIQEALISTALGLAVAIPSWAFYNFMVSRVDYFVREVEYLANSMNGMKK
jgi:biopolymer transport protein ExbB